MTTDRTEAARPLDFPEDSEKFITPGGISFAQFLAVAQFIIICRWFQLIHKDRLAPLENAPFSTLWARKRYRVAQRFASIDELQTAIN
jgi:hypothetical protein